MAKEMQRTCKRDGAVWYVPLKEAKERPPNRMEMTGAKMQAAGDRMTLWGGGSRSEHLLANLEAKRARVVRNNSCPQCGSSSYTERKVKI
jgi:hypothetical protein